MRESSEAKVSQLDLRLFFFRVVLIDHNASNLEVAVLEAPVVMMQVFECLEQLLHDILVSLLWEGTILRIKNERFEVTFFEVLHNHVDLVIALE